MTDDRFEEFLKDTARDYNVPPKTPREVMWARIQAARRDQVRTRTRRFLSNQWLPMGLAAAAVLALGVWIGRASQSSDTTTTAAPARESTLTASADQAYRVAAARYLGRAEALITLFVVDARTGANERRNERRVAGAARELLTTNRLLQASPAANDPRMRRLLQDLELVLAQIAQVSAEHGVDEVDLIIQGLNESGVITRLRTEVPREPALTSPQGEL